MRNFPVEFVYDGQKEMANCEENVVGPETQYHLTPHNQDLLEKFGKTLFRKAQGDYLSGEPINDLEYYSALKEGLENYLYQKNS